jgi:hypothetical protein
MKKSLLAVFSVLGLGVGSAFAQGLPAGARPPSYGTYAFTDHRNDPQVHFLGQGTVFAKIFGHSDSDQTVASRTAAKGS